MLVGVTTWTRWHICCERTRLWMEKSQGISFKVESDRSEKWHGL